MARRVAEDEDWGEDDDSDFDGVEEDEVDGDDDEEPTIPCPYCQRQIHEDAQRCPYCERYISAEDAPPAQKPWWIIVGILVCLYIVYRWIVG